MIPQRSNSGVKLEGLYEIQIFDSHGVEHPHGDDCGGVYPRAELTPSYHLIDAGFPPRVNAAMPAGVWQTLEITFSSPRINVDGEKTSNARFVRVVLNGETIQQNVEVSSPTGAAWRLETEKLRGPILLQGDHGQVAFKNIKIRKRDH